MSAMTPYQAAKIVNAKLVSDNINKKLPPQMLYTYAKKSYIETTIVDGKIRITEEGLKKWYLEYTKKFKVTNEAENIDENQLSLDI